jgi:hypothetical protein
MALGSGDTWGCQPRANRSRLMDVLGTDYATGAAEYACAARIPGERIVIKTSEFSTIAVLVTATAAFVALQQHRGRERQPTPPSTIEAKPVARSTDARLTSPADIDLAASVPLSSQTTVGP